MPAPEAAANCGARGLWPAGLTASPQPAVKSAAARMLGRAAVAVRLSMIPPRVERAPHRVNRNSWCRCGARVGPERCGTSPEPHAPDAQNCGTRPCRVAPIPGVGLSLKRPILGRPMRAWSIIALLSLASPLAAQRPIAWDSLSAEAVRTLSAYLKINTTNPPGTELEGARFLQAILTREGLDAQILDTVELGGARANLYARLRGDGTKRAIALVHHLDVVPADARYWTVEPFSGAIKDGYVWGRGALDMRGEGIVQLMALLALKRSVTPLHRDIVFIGNADEELGGTGAQVFVQRHPDLLQDVEFLMTEGGDNLVEDGRLRYYGVGVAEKRTFWQRLTVHGTPSPGPRPTQSNPVPRLVAALDRIARYETPLHVTPGVEKYFRDISARYAGMQRAWLADIR